MVDENRIALCKVAQVYQHVVGGAVGDWDCRGLVERHRVRQGDRPPGIQHDLLGVSPETGHCEHTVTGTEPGDPLAHVHHLTCSLVAGGERVFRVGAVQPLTHHQVREVDSCPVHSHSYLAGTGHRVRVLDNSDAVDATDSRIDHFAHSITHQVVTGGLAALEMLENGLQAIVVVRQGVPGPLWVDNA